jgi:hypothetical protein
MEDLGLTAEELGYLEPIHAKISASARFSLTLQWLLESWEGAVLTTEGGSADEITYEEFANDVSCRGIIEDGIVRGAPEGLKAKIAAALTPLDERYRAATGEVDQPWFGALHRAEWWWYRCPRTWRWYREHGVDR